MMLQIKQMLAEEMIKTHIPKNTHRFNFASMVIEKLYDKNLNGLDKDTLISGVTLDGILEHKDVEFIEREFGSDVTMLLVNLSVDDHGISSYEKLFKAYDFLFAKLALRLADIWISIIGGDSDQFKKYIGEYNELRRKILKHCPDLISFMDYEADLIKFGRNHYSGKPAFSYKYEQLNSDELWHYWVAFRTSAA